MSCASECIGRCVGGTINVRDKEFVDQLVAEAEKNLIRQSLSPSRSRVHCGSSRLHTPRFQSSGGGCRQYAHISTVPEDDPDFSLTRPWLNAKVVETLQLASNPDCSTTREVYDALLCTEDLYKQDFDYMGMDQMILNRRRQEILHKRWSENVFDPIRCEVEKEANGPDFRELQVRKRQLYKEYLEHVNRKGHVFLEVGDPAEYFAFSLRPGLKANTGPLNDPLLFQERERNREDAVAFRLATGSAIRFKDAERIRLPILPLVPLGRHGVNWKKWNEMQLGQIDSEVRTLSRRKLRLDRNHSNVSLQDKEEDDSEKLIYVNIMNNHRMQEKQSSRLMH